MRNGPKLKQLLAVCDISLSMDEDSNLTLTTIHKGTYQTRTKDAKTFSAVLDKAYRQMLKDASAPMQEHEEAPAKKWKEEDEF